MSIISVSKRLESSRIRLNDNRMAGVRVREMVRKATESVSSSKVEYER